jgi:hypothetical protein
LGAEVLSFNDLFQPTLFPDVTYGMASNIWAEMWSSGGWPLLLLFLISYVGMMKPFSILVNKGTIITRSTIAVIASYWSFYFHRNEIVYEFALIKRVLLVMIPSLIIAMFIKNMISMQKNFHR